MTTLRPSSLPKIAACPNYENSPFEAGPPAQRGTLMDEAFREAMQGNNAPLESLDEDISAIDDSLAPGAEAIAWAVDRVKLIAGDEPVITDEESLFTEIPMIPVGGTMDGDIPTKLIGLDLKSGQIRNYKEQMAAYALGRMTSLFEDEYTMKLVFCDQKQVITHHFTLDEATQIVATMRERHTLSDLPATPCTYCGWCGAKDRCEARGELATRVSAHMNVQERFEQIIEDPEELAAFLTGADALKDFADIAKKAGREMIEAGIDVPGYKRVKGRAGAKFMPSDLLAEHCKKKGITIDQLVESIGSMNASKFLELVGGKADDYNFQQKGSGSPYLSKK